MNIYYSGNSADLSPDEMHLPATAHPWLRGDGLFETIKTEEGKIFFLDAHLERLKISSQSMLFERAPIEEISMRAKELVERTAGIERGRLRLTLFPDSTFLITHEDSPLSTAPQKLFLSEKVRYSSSFLSGHKSISYGEASLAARIAKTHGCDDLLFLNEHEEIVETGMANILLEDRGVFYTPPLNSGCLSGIVRSTLLSWFNEVQEKTITLDDISQASGLYIISSLREIDLVSELRSADGLMRKFKISATAEKLRTDYLINSRSSTRK